MVVGCQPYAPAAFTPRNIPGTHFHYGLSRPQGHGLVGRKYVTEKSSERNREKINTWKRIRKSFLSQQRITGYKMNHLVPCQSIIHVTPNTIKTQTKEFPSFDPTNLRRPLAPACINIMHHHVPTIYRNSRFYNAVPLFSFSSNTTFASRSAKTLCTNAVITLCRMSAPAFRLNMLPSIFTVYFLNIQRGRLTRLQTDLTS